MKRATVYKERWAVAAGIWLACGFAAAQGPEPAPATAPAPRVEIDYAAVKIDVAAGVREIDASLRKAVVTAGDERGPVQVAIAEKRARG